MNTWKPGQRAMVEVEVLYVDYPDAVQVSIGGESGYYLDPADLLPVSAPDADTIEADVQAAFKRWRDEDGRRLSDPDGLFAAGYRSALLASVPDVDTIERARNVTMSAIRCYMPFGWEEGEPDGFAASIVAALGVSGLLAVREPGRSEEEAEFDTAFANGTPATISTASTHVIVTGRSEAETEWAWRVNDSGHITPSFTLSEVGATPDGLMLVRREVGPWLPAVQVAGTEGGED